MIEIGSRIGYFARDRAGHSIPASRDLLSLPMNWLPECTPPVPQVSLRIEAKAIGAGVEQ